MMNFLKRLFKRKEFLVIETTITQVLNGMQIVINKGYSDGITKNTKFYFYKKYDSGISGINPYLRENGSGEILQLEESFVVIRPFIGVLTSSKEVGDIVKYKIEKK